MRKHSKLILTGLIVPTYILVQLAKRFPEFVDRYYSDGLYPFLSKCFRYVLGWLPFSFGDFVYGVGLILILRWLVLNRKRIYKDTVKWLLDVGAVLGVVYFVFHLLWGFNYYRNPLHKNLNLEDNYTTDQLLSVTKKLIEKSNSLQLQLAKNDTVKVVLPYTKTEILKQTPNGYKALEKEFPHLEYHPKSLKTSIFSLPLTYMGFSGYLNPLTNEAQVDYLIPEYKFPTTSAHEIAHQLGYALENEANFMGFLASVNNPDIYFKYCGYTFGLRHCLNEIYKRNPDTYYKLVETINLGILKNYQEVQDFWNGYKNPSEIFFKSTYTTYLKANNQAKGMESYSYVVALLVNYLDKKSF